MQLGLNTNTGMCAVCDLYFVAFHFLGHRQWSTEITKVITNRAPGKRLAKQRRIIEGHKGEDKVDFMGNVIREDESKRQ